MERKQKVIRLKEIQKNLRTRAYSLFEPSAPIMVTKDQNILTNQSITTQTQVSWRCLYESSISISSTLAVLRRFYHS